MGGYFREQFRLRNFGMTHEDPSLFVKLQCFKPITYIPWTVFWLLFYIYALVFEVYYYRDKGTDYFTYLTNDTFCLQSAAATLDFLVTIYILFRRHDIRDGSADRTEWYISVYWVLFNIVNTASLFVSIGYFSLKDPEFTHGSINLHICNSVYTLLTLLLSAKPVRILHLYQPMLYAAAYIAFTTAFQLTGHAPVYGSRDPIDWHHNQLKSVALSLSVIFVVVPLGHLFCFMVYTLRILCWSKYNAKKDGPAMQYSTLYQAY